MPEKNKVNIDPYSVVGTTGLKQSGGMVYEELLTKLQGIQGVRYFTEMINNASPIGVICYIIQALIRQTEVIVEPSQVSDKKSIEAAAFVQECLEDMEKTFDEFLTEVISCLWFGFAYMEKIYKIRRGKRKDPRLRSQYSDGKIGWRDISIRSQDTLFAWEFDENNNILGYHQQDTWSGRFAFIPIEKSILFRTQSFKNNPEGKSIFRTAAFDWYYYKKISEIEGIGIERDLTGLLVMEVPAELLSTDATPDQIALRSMIENMLSQLKRDEREYALVPSEMTSDNTSSGYKLKLMTSGGQRQLDTTKIKHSYKVNMLQSVLMQYVELGMHGVGSFALASSHTNLSAVALGGFLELIAETFTKQAIGPLMELNGVDSMYWPSLRFGDIEGLDLDVLGRYLSILANAGILPLDDEEINAKLLALADLPAPKNPDKALKGCRCGSVYVNKKVNVLSGLAAKIREQGFK